MKTALGIILITVLMISLWKPITSAVKVALFVSQLFPQLPLKPLHMVSKPPIRETVTLDNHQNKIIAEMFLPDDGLTHPAIIVAMGVFTNDKDKPILFSFCETLSRLGFVVMWPRLEDLDLEKAKIEQPQTFARAFRYLEKHPNVDKNSVSFAGFSTGSSLALVASEDPAINQKVKAVVFFGGYYNIVDYLQALATKQMITDQGAIPWQPNQEGINYASDALKQYDLSLDQFKDPSSLPSDKIASLKSYSPDGAIDQLKAPIFILHDQGDTFVPYAESIKLKNAAGDKVPTHYHLANLFAHVQPTQQLSVKVAQEFANLTVFLYQVFSFL